MAVKASFRDADTVIYIHTYTYINWDHIRIKIQRNDRIRNNSRYLLQNRQDSREFASGYTVPHSISEQRFRHVYISRRHKMAFVVIRTIMPVQLERVIPVGYSGLIGRSEQREYYSFTWCFQEGTKTSIPTSKESVNNLMHVDRLKIFVWYSGLFLN